MKVSWRRGQKRIGRRLKRRVSGDRYGVLTVRRGRRRDAGLYTCLATATTTDRRRLRSTANTTVRFHQLTDALQLVQARWMNTEDDAVDVEGLHGSAVMRLGPLSYQLSSHELPESYSVAYIRHRLVRITIIIICFFRLTHADESRVSIAFIHVCLCVCFSHDRTKTTEITITKLATRI